MSSLNPQPLPPSPNWARALPPGPDTSVKITEAYAAMVARDAYFWAWPLVNLYNKRLNFKDVPEPMMVGPGPAAPLNRVAMLTDYIEPEERLVACPNQDVVYGAGSLAFDLSPVVIEVPDMGERYWTLGFLDAWTNPWAYAGRRTTGNRAQRLFVHGPRWQGEVPAGMHRIAAPGDDVWVIGRILVDHDARDHAVVHALQDQFAIRRPDGTPAHHLLDPATGLPAYTGIVQATAIAPTVVSCRAAIGRMASASARFCCRRGGWNSGERERQSSLASAAARASVKAPVSSPDCIGL